MKHLCNPTWYPKDWGLSLLNPGLQITLPSVFVMAYELGYIQSETKVLVTQSCLLVTPWTVAHHAPLSMEFSRQEYWSWLPFPSPGDLPDPGIEPGSPALKADSLPTEPPGKTLPFSFSKCAIKGTKACLAARSLSSTETESIFWNVS